MPKTTTKKTSNLTKRLREKYRATHHKCYSLSSLPDKDRLAAIELINEGYSLSEIIG